MERERERERGLKGNEPEGYCLQIFINPFRRAISFVSGCRNTVYPDSGPIYFNRRTNHPVLTVHPVPRSGKLLINSRA